MFHTYCRQNARKRCNTNVLHRRNQFRLFLQNQQYLDLQEVLSRCQLDVLVYVNCYQFLLLLEYRSIHLLNFTIRIETDIFT